MSEKFPTMTEDTPFGFGKAQATGNTAQIGSTHIDLGAR